MYFLILVVAVRFLVLVVELGVVLMAVFDFEPADCPIGKFAFSQGTPLYVPPPF